MRVISQNGNFDFPYEQIVLSVDRTNVICKPISNLGCRYYLLGVYSTKEKAEKAMEMLRNLYGDYITAKCDGYYFAFNHPKVFRFPQESEVV